MSGHRREHEPMRRPPEGRLLLGVCAAIARRLDLDPTLVRIVAAIGLFVLTTPVLVAYAGLALVVPRDDGRMLIGGEPRDRREIDHRLDHRRARGRPRDRDADDLRDRQTGSAASRSGCS